VENLALNKRTRGPDLPEYCFNCTKFGKLILGENHYKNSSRDEIANVKFTQCARKLPEFTEIMQNNAITPFKVTDFGTNRKLIYDFLLVINTN